MASLELLYSKYNSKNTINVSGNENTTIDWKESISNPGEAEKTNSIAQQFFNIIDGIKAIFAPVGAYLKPAAEFVKNILSNFGSKPDQIRVQGNDKSVNLVCNSEDREDPFFERIKNCTLKELNELNSYTFEKNKSEQYKLAIQNAIKEKEEVTKLNPSNGQNPEVSVESEVTAVEEVEMVQQQLISKLNIIKEKKKEIEKQKEKLQLSYKKIKEDCRECSYRQ